MRAREHMRNASFNICMRHIRVLSLVVMGTLLLTACAAYGKAVDTKQLNDAVIARMIAAYGGKDVINRTKSVYAEGEIVAHMKKDMGTYKRWSERDRKLRVETAYSRSSETRILSGVRGWRSDGGPLEEVTGHQFLAMVYQYKQLDLPYGMLNGKYRISDSWKDRMDGRDVKVFIIEDSEGPPMRFCVDLKTYLIIRVEGAFDMNGRTAILGVTFSDFRKVDGYPFPYRVQNFGSGMAIGETQIRKYVVNPEMKGSLFRP